MSVTWKFRSDMQSVKWPAVPGVGASTALALQYQLARTQWWPPADLLRHQSRQLEVLLAYAYNTLRFWRSRLKAAGYSPQRPFTIESLQAIPLLTREDIQAHAGQLLSRASPAAHGPVTTGETSGSTGRPIVFYQNDLAQLFWRAFTLRDHVWHARDLRGKLAAVRAGVEAASTRGWGVATDLALETGTSVTLDIRTDIDAQLTWLQSENPHYLITHASNLRALAKRALERGIGIPGLRQVRSYAEALAPDVRDLCRRAWNAPLADVYSAQEVGYIALQCPRFEHYHVQAENLLVEILDADNKPCKLGEIGRVVVTSLHNFAMPLIRYDIGDYAEAGDVCPCGRGLPVLKHVAGRLRNMLTLPDGRQRWPSFPSHEWSRAAPVTQLQMVQKSRDLIILRVAAPRSLTTGEEAALIAALQTCLKHPFAMQIERVPEISRGPGFKFEEFISELGPER